LPLVYYSLQVFRDIENPLGEFLEADMSFKTSDEMIVAQILVRMDLMEGLVEEMEIEVGSNLHVQSLHVGLRTCSRTLSSRGFDKIPRNLFSFF